MEVLKILVLYLVFAFPGLYRSFPIYVYEISRQLSQEAKEKEDRRMETDVAFDIAPVIDIHIPHNEANTTLTTQLQEPKKKKKAEIAIRKPRRSSRPRAGIPAR